MTDYICNRCNKKFNNKSTYNIHLNRKTPCKLIQTDVTITPNSITILKSKKKKNKDKDSEKDSDSDKDSDNDKDINKDSDKNSESSSDSDININVNLIFQKLLEEMCNLKLHQIQQYKENKQINEDHIKLVNTIKKLEKKIKNMEQSVNS